MNEAEIRQEVRYYLENELELCKTWYKDVYSADLESGMEQVAWQLWPKQEFSTRFKTWCQFNLPTFKKLVCEVKFGQETICEKWQRLREKEALEHIIVAVLVDIGVSPFFPLHHTPVIVTMLATNQCLDALCDKKPF